MSDLHRDPENVIELWTRQGPCQIELLSGDITRLPAEEMVDIIMVSAFPGDYAPMSGTVIGALKTKLGISVMDLSMNKELDLRFLFSCWLSKPISTQGSPFKKLLCFERKRGSQLGVPAQISEMFRVFVPVFNNQEHTVITPLLATGHQGHSKPVVCGAMVDAAIQWIYAGLPLRKFKIVVYEGINEALQTMFTALKKKHMAKNQKMKNRIFKKQFDLYITCSPKDDAYLQKIKHNLERNRKDIKLYIETKQFDINKVWQDDIFNVMIACKRIIVILSPAFLESAECLEEYNMAMCCNRLLGVNVLIPFYVDTITNLPTYMGLVQWIDCRVRKEGDTTEEKLKSACGNVLVALEDQTPELAEQVVSAPETKSDKDKYQFDVFISYSHKTPDKAEKLLATFKSIDPTIKVFYDRSALTTGSNWQNMLYESVGECRCFIALLSSSYISSTVCQEEYNLALARFLSKDKDMMLIPLMVESVKDIPASMSHVQITNFVEDFDKSVREMAVSVVDWLKLTVENRPTQYTNKEAVDIERGLSASRCEMVRKQYKVVKTSKDKEFKRVVPLQIPEEKLSQINDSKVDIALSYANDSTHLAGSFCALLDQMYPNLNISVHSHIDQKRYSALDNARKIVMFISNEFLRNEHQMQELHLAICRQRALKTDILYLIKANPLWERPFFPRILPYDVACSDSVWTEFQEQFLSLPSFEKGKKDELKKMVFGKTRRLEHASTFLCSHSEYFAVTKAVDDVLESLLSEKKEQLQQVSMLLNVVAMQSDGSLNDAGETSVDNSNTHHADITQQPGNDEKHCVAHNEEQMNSSNNAELAGASSDEKQHAHLDNNSLVNQNAESEKKMDSSKELMDTVHTAQANQTRKERSSACTLI